MVGGMSKRVESLDASLEERSPTGGDMLTRVAKTTISRVNLLFSRTQTPCYLPPSIAGNVPHLTPGATAAAPATTGMPLVVVLQYYCCSDGVLRGCGDFLVQTIAAKWGT